jgi:flagellar basal body-associated protein FliL
LSRQIYEDLLPAEGKERLRAEALMTLQNALKKATGRKIAEDLFFTSLVLQ